MEIWVADIQIILRVIGLDTGVDMTVYIPQDPRYAAWNRTFGGIGQNIWDMINMGFQQKFVEKQQQRRFEQQKELIDYRAKNKQPELPYKIGEFKKIPFGEDQFVLGVYTGTNKKNEGLPPGFESTGITGKRTATIQLTPEQKMEQYEKKQEISSQKQIETDAAKRAAAQRQAIQSYKFPIEIEKTLATRYGSMEWQDKEPYEKEELIFNEMNKIIREAHPDRMITFDPSRNAWIDVKSKKIIRKYVGHIPLRYKRNIR